MWLLLTTDTVNPVSVSRARPDKRSPPPSRMAQNCRDVPSLELVPLGWDAPIKRKLGRKPSGRAPVCEGSAGELYYQLFYIRR